MRIIASCAGTAGLAVMSVLFSACETSNQDRVNNAGAANLQPVDNEDAIGRIASARCNREQSCNNVAAGKTYNTYEDCMGELGYNARAEIRRDQCPDGINTSALSQCLTNIENERCGNPLDSFTRVVACRKAKLCQR